MPQKRGSGKQNNAASRGQAPGNHGRGQGGAQNSRFADHSQPITIGFDDSDEYMVLDFNNMGELSGLTNGHSNQSRGRGRGRGFNINAPEFKPQFQRGPPAWRGRGRGRGGYVPPPAFVVPAFGTPKWGKQQNGPSSSFRGRGGGLGFVTSPERRVVKNWDLATRPLLKPIKFVRAKERLFEADPEELLQAHKIPPHPSDQLDPQTDRLAAVFDEGQPSALASTTNTSGQDTPLRAQDTTVQAIAQETTVSITEPPTLVNDKMVAHSQNFLSLLTASMDTHSGVSTAVRSGADLFFIDTTGQSAQKSQLEVPLFNAQASAILGEHEPDEIILIPSPATRTAQATAPFEGRKNKTTSEDEIPIPTVTMENLSLNLTKPETNGVENKSLLSFSVPKARRSTSTPFRARKEARRRKQDIKFAEDIGNVFGFKDGREGLRQGDSDLNVGSESSEEIEDNGMEVDDELNAAAMASFARGVGAQHMSMADVEIEAALENGDMDSDSDETEDNDLGEEEEELEMNEVIVIQDDDEDDDWSDDEDMDMTPTTSFKSHLKRIRERTPGFTDAETGIEDSERTWADRDEDYLTQIEILMDDNKDLLSKQDRKTRNAFFKTISKADPEYPFAAVWSRRTSEEDKDVYDHLAEQWHRDRNKKAEYKRLREAKRAEEGGLGNGKVKGKGKNKNLDLEDIEQMMRDLVASGSRRSFELPPMDKPMRVKIHVMAEALSLNSTSSGSKKGSRAMTISRTKHTGLRPIKEGKLNATLNRKGGGDLKGIREGEVIGHQAAKISEDNRGYKLLAQMGWSEGDRIGKEGGLDAPLIAIMKKSKLGLGHSASRPQ